jgi:hypothetical protein
MGERHGAESSHFRRKRVVFRHPPRATLADMPPDPPAPTAPPPPAPNVACRILRRSDAKSDKQRGEEAGDHPDVLVAKLAARQWGVVAAGELEACGLSPTEIRTRVRRGFLHRMHHGVYVVGHAFPPLEACFLAAVKACGPGAVLSHHAAAAHLELLPWSDRAVEVTIRDTTPRTRPGVAVHRTTRLDRADVTRHRGIPTTTPARTVVDLAANATTRRLRRAVREAQGRHGTTIPQILRALERAGRRRGARRLLKIIANGPAPTRSVLEDIVLDLLLSAGFAHPDVNTPLRLAGRTVVPDFRWPAQRLVVEADGARWHDGEIATEEDAERQALLEAHGHRVLRVTWRQAVTRRAQTVARVAQAGAPTRHTLGIR